MEQFPLISVIIPVYRTEKYLRKCVESVRAQTYPNLEIILIDDGSPDNCGKICDEYAAKDKRIRVVHQTNQGLSAARNAGLGIAKGEYVGFVDSDDYVEPDIYEYLYALITKENAAMAMCNICEDEGYHTKQQNKQPYVLITALDIFKYGSIWVYAWNKLYRMSFVSGLRFNTATSYGEDGLFNFEFMKKNALIALGNQAKYHYCYKQNPNALVSNFQPKHLNKIVLMDECLKYAKQHNLTLFYRRASNAQLMHVTKWLYQIARSTEEDRASIEFLTAYIKKHFMRFIFARMISARMKLFISVACVNFNWARKVLSLVYTPRQEKARQQP